MSYRRQSFREFFSTPGAFVWNKLPGCVLVFVSGIGAGRGGQGGGLVATAATGIAGSNVGGPGGGFNQMFINADLLPNTINGNIGAGGLGAAGAIVNGVGPTAAFVLTETHFGDFLIFSSITSVALTRSSNMYNVQISATGIGGNGGIGANNTASQIAAAAGGSGGGFTAGTGAAIAAQNGGFMGMNSQSNTSGGGYFAQLAGGVLGPNANGGDGIVGNSLGATSIYGGSGGGGGGAFAGAGRAGNGGNGGFPGGGGGCGGAGVNGTSTAGNGGNGAGGLIMVVQLF